MKTVLGMVTIGPDSTMRTLALRRASAYAAKHGYDFQTVCQPIRVSDRSPHWEKTLLPAAFPGFDRYVIIDDDMLINHRLAPPLPAVRPGCLALVREPLPEGSAPPGQWVGNTGFILLERDGLDLLESAYEFGEHKEIPPGYGDQPALNAVAWREGRVTRLPWNWNYMLMADWLIRTHRQADPWTKSACLRRFAKITLTFRLLTHRESVCVRLRDSYAVHLTWYREGAPLVDRILG